MRFPDLVRLRIQWGKMLASNSLYYIYLIIHWVISLYSWIIFLWAIMSWLPINFSSKFLYWLNWIVEPFINIFRRFIPTFAEIDFSPIIAILVLQFANRGLALIFVQLLQ